MANEWARTIDGWMLFQRASLETLLTNDTSYLSPALAGHYGIAHSFTSPWEPVQQVTSQRAGVLTMGAFLTHFASPPQRGIELVERLTCARPPPAPPIPVSVWSDPQRLSAKEIITTQYGDANPPCRACHGLYVGYAIALDRYDSLGRYREQIAGAPIDTSYSLATATPAPLPRIVEEFSFSNSYELGKALSASRGVRACLAEKLAESAGLRALNASELECVLTDFEHSGTSFWTLTAALSPLLGE